MTNGRLAASPATSGSIDEDGFVRITGRKKDLMITSSGKNISAATSSLHCARAAGFPRRCVRGRAPHLVALLTLDADEAPALAEHVGVECDLSAMAHDEDVVAELAREVEQVNSRFARIEQVNGSQSRSAISARPKVS